jgi:orotidine 5'-phosphate decarboxylase subfamily 1
MEMTVQKESLVILAADRSTIAGLIDLIETVGEKIAALKTHIDLVDDWTPEGWSELCGLATSADLIIMEDRKFADIGKISRDQMAGVYDIRSWADLVTAHMISGPDIVEGLLAGWAAVGREGGVLLLAQMSSRGNLLDALYGEQVVGQGRESDGCFGFIGNGSRPEELRRLRAAVGTEKMIWTPGVNLDIGEGELGQRYGDPHEAVLAGSDGIIVGSGIHCAEDPLLAASEYATTSWEALLKRTRD